MNDKPRTDKKLILLFITYQIIQLIALPFFLLYLLIRKINKKGIGSLKERIGLLPQTKSLENVIWIHAVSVGEILSIQNLINQIRQQIPKTSVYLTTGTPAGKEIALKNLNAAHLSFLPFDFLLPMFLAFQRIQPKSIIIVEAETWPNFLMLANFFKIPTYSLNARISERSKNKYIKLGFCFRPLFDIFKKIFVQSQIDQLNFEKLGIDKNKLEVLGNIKALNVLHKKSTLTKTDFLDKNFQTLLVGSVHPGELDIYLNLFNVLKPKFPQLKLILAPRHFNWQQELITKTQATNCSYFLWKPEDIISEENFAKKILSKYDIILVCKLGELFKLYPFCSIFFLGGTFVPVGGHNLLEPAVWGKLSIIGPYYHNCKDIADKLEQHKALIKVASANELAAIIEKLLSDPIQVEQLGNKAYFWLEQEASLVQKKLDSFIKDLNKDQYKDRYN
jgi:3-deoxy-D-manno-octulosonic-acid transferase